MKVNIVAVKNRSYFAVIKYLIYLFQGMVGRTDKYSHLAIELDVEDHKSYMDATLKDGVAIKSEDYFLEKYELVHRWESVGDFEKTKPFIIEHLGKKYAGEQLFGYLFEQLKIWKTNLLGANGRRIVCSELIALWLCENGIEIKDSDEYDLIETEKLLNKNFKK